MAFQTETVDDIGRYGELPGARHCSGGRRRSSVLSGTIVNVAVPDVMGAYGVGQDQAQPMATSFNVAMTTCQLLNAWVVAVWTRYGYTLTLIIFTVGSVIAGLADSFGMLVAGRVIQGMATGIIQPLIMVTVFQVFPEERRGFAMGIYHGAGLGRRDGAARRRFGPRGPQLALYLLAALTIARSLIAVRSDFPAFGSQAGRSAIRLGRLYPDCRDAVLHHDRFDGRSAQGLDIRLYLAAHFVGHGDGYRLHQEPTPFRVDFDRYIAVSEQAFVIVLFVTFFSGIGNFTTTYSFPVFTQLVQGLTPLDAGSSLLPGMLLAVCAVPFTGHLADKLEPGKP